MCYPDLNRYNYLWSDKMQYNINLNIPQFPEIEKIRQLLDEKQQNIVIVSHRNPDGDAIGSSYALYNFLKKMGHNVNVVVPNSYPKFLSWIPGVKNTLVFEWHKKKCIELFKSCNILFTVDFNDLSRIREFEQHLMPVNSFKVLIDHHPNPGSFADISISDTRVSSTAELVYLFLKKLNRDELFDKDIANCIYTGIMTDTGCFSFNSSCKQTFEVVGNLLEMGLDKDQVYSYVYNDYSHDRMKLLGYSLNEKMVYFPEYNAAYISLSQEDMRKHNFKIGDSEGFVNIPLSIKGVKFSVLFTEKEDIVKVSLRSKGNFPVNNIASKYYSGGGHMNASGGESKLSLQETITRFEMILEEYKDELSDE